VAGDRHAADAGAGAADAGRAGGRHERAEREKTAELLGRISQGRSVVVIEHDMDFVKSIAHKVTVLHQGKILAEGSMEKVQSDPKVIDVYLGH
jgi:urea transport system ATP-binding protein